MKKYKIIIDVSKWRVLDIINFKTDLKLNKDEKIRFPSDFDFTDTMILNTIYLFNDEINTNEIARVTLLPYPTLKDKLRELGDVIEINKDKFPNTYRIKKNVQIVPLSKYRKEKLENWNQFRDEWENSMNKESQKEQDEKSRLDTELKEIRQRQEFKPSKRRRKSSRH